MSPNFQGAMYMMLAMVAYPLNDMIIKLIANDIGLFQSIFVRGIFATIIMLILAIKNNAITWETIQNLKEPAFVIRTIGEVGATICFLFALINMPIANATAILQLLPLVVTLAAAIFLKEKVGPKRYAAILLGFIGVTLIIQPGADGFNIHSINALLAVAFITLRDLATKRLRKKTRSMFVALVGIVAVLILGGIGAMFETWNHNSLSVYNLTALAFASVMVVAAYIFSILAMRTGDVGFTAPFRYTTLIWAIIIGVIVWGEIPTITETAGGIIIVASGLFMLHRQNKIGQNKIGQNKFRQKKL